MEPRPLPYDARGQGDALVLVPGGLTGWLSWIPHQARLASTRRTIRVQPIHNELGSAGQVGDPSYTAVRDRGGAYESLPAPHRVPRRERGRPRGVSPHRWFRGGRMRTPGHTPTGCGGCRTATRCHGSPRRRTGRDAEWKSCAGSTVPCCSSAGTPPHPGLDASSMCLPACCRGLRCLISWVTTPAIFRALMSSWTLSSSTWPRPSDFGWGAGAWPYCRGKILP